MRRRSHKRREMDVEYEEKKASLSLTQVGNPPPPPPRDWDCSACNEDLDPDQLITHEGDANLRLLALQGSILRLYASISSFSLQCWSGSSYQKQFGHMRTRIRNLGSFTMRRNCLSCLFDGLKKISDIFLLLTNGSKRTGICLCLWSADKLLSLFMSIEPVVPKILLLLDMYCIVSTVLVFLG